MGWPTARIFGFSDSAAQDLLIVIDSPSGLRMSI
jgi:hypothetical protein